MGGGADSRLLPEGVHKAFMVSNTLIYLLCKPLLRALAGKIALPELGACTSNWLTRAPGSVRHTYLLYLCCVNMETTHNQ